MRSNINIKSKLLVLLLAVFVAFGNVACGKESIEKSIATTVRAVKAARQVTTEQHEFGFITDAEYASRLKTFKSLYISIDTLGDKITAFGEINATNKQEILTAVQDVNASVIALINSGNLGVKNPRKQAEFSKWALLASGTLNSIKIAIAASKKTIDTKGVSIEKVVE